MGGLRLIFLVYCPCSLSWTVTFSLSGLSLILAILICLLLSSSIVAYDWDYLTCFTILLIGTRLFFKPVSNFGFIYTLLCSALRTGGIKSALFRWFCWDLCLSFVGGVLKFFKFRPGNLTFFDDKVYLSFLAVVRWLVFSEGSNLDLGVLVWILVSPLLWFGLGICPYLLDFSLLEAFLLSITAGTGIYSFISSS